MPKIKTRSAVKSRFTFTKTGKVMRRQQGNRHLKAAKNNKRSRRLKEPIMVGPSFAKKIKAMAGR